MMLRRCLKPIKARSGFPPTVDGCQGNDSTLHVLLIPLNLEISPLKKIKSKIVWNGAQKDLTLQNISEADMLCIAAGWWPSVVLSSANRKTLGGVTAGHWGMLGSAFVCTGAAFLAAAFWKNRTAQFLTNPPLPDSHFLIPSVLLVTGLFPEGVLMDVMEVLQGQKLYSVPRCPDYCFSSSLTATNLAQLLTICITHSRPGTPDGTFPIC